MPLQLVFWAINKHDVWLAGGGVWPKSSCWNITIYKIWHLRQKKTNSKQTYYEDQKVITGHHLQPWVASFMAGHLLTIKREVFLLNLSPWSNLQKQILQLTSLSLAWYFLTHWVSSAKRESDMKANEIVRIKIGAVASLQLNLAAAADWLPSQQAGAGGNQNRRLHR